MTFGVGMLSKVGCMPAGTVRENLDPMGHFEDRDMVSILKEVSLLLHTCHVGLDAGSSG